MTASSIPRIVLSGVDSLYLSTQSPVRDEVAQALAKAQDEAKKAAADDPPPPLYLGEHSFVVRPHGTRNAPFLLASDHMDLAVNPRAPRNFPTMMLELRALFLWQQGVVRAGSVAEAVAEEIAAPLLVSADSGPPRLGVHFQVSRIDLCADTQGWTPCADPRVYTTPAVHIDAHYVRKQFTGITFGRGGSIVARIYDKTKEIETSNKGWFRALWTPAPGYQAGDTVWRLEFQLRREELRKWKLDRSGHRLLTLDDVAPSTGQLWRRLCSRWLSLRARTATDRQRLRPEWEGIRGGPFDGPIWNGSDENLYRIAREEGERRCLGQLSGYLARNRAAVAYRYGTSVHDEAVLPILLQDVRRHDTRRGTTPEKRAEEHLAAWKQDERAALAGPVAYQGTPFRRYVVGTSAPTTRTVNDDNQPGPEHESEAA